MTWEIYWSKNNGIIRPNKCRALFFFLERCGELSVILVQWLDVCSTSCLAGHMRSALAQLAGGVNESGLQDLMPWH